MNLMEMLHRVKSAAGWDEEIDGLFAKIIGAMPNEAVWDGTIWYTGGYGNYKFHYSPREFTESVDDAAALVAEMLPGSRVVIDFSSQVPATTPVATIYWHPGKPAAKAHAKTPALALCAAMLRAMIAQEQNQ